MKNVTLFLILLSIVSISTLYGSKRTVLCEMFSNVGCPPCVPANQGLDNWLSTYANADRVAVIKYHVWWPQSNDPFYVANRAVSSARVTFYGCTYAPQMFIQGEDNGYLFDPWPGVIQNALADSSHFTINVSGNLDSTGGPLSISIRSDEAPIPDGSVNVFVAIVESDLHFTGNNGDPVHNDVMRALLPTKNGASFIIGSNDVFTFDQPIVFDPSWKYRNCKIIVFLQVAETKEILQAYVSPATDLHQTPIAVKNGWNLVSLSFEVSDSSRVTLFPSALSDAIAYTDSYHSLPNLERGRGYWMKFPGEQTVWLSGKHIDSLSVPVSAGWNIIGAISDTIAVGSVTSSPPGLITSPFFGYAQGYTRSDSLYPSKGYWVKVSQDCNLILTK